MNYIYSCGYRREEKDVAEKKTATVVAIVLPRRKRKETLSDYRCSVAVKERKEKEKAPDYSCSVGSKKKRKRETA